MSEEIAQANELVRLTTINTDLYKLIKQMQNELEAERRHSAIVWADNAAWVLAARAYILAPDLDGRLRSWGVLSDLAIADHPGTKLLSVFDAARTFRRAYLICEYAATLGESVDLYEAVDKAQAALFQAIEQIDGPMVYDKA